MPKRMKQAYKEATKGPWIDGKLDTQYKVVEDDNSITISFQGSISKLDWILNTFVWKKPYRKMNNLFFVHAGFLKKYKAVQDEIYRAVKYTDKEIIILGHSQGGALAMLFHEDVYFYTGVQPKTTVFGCPRVFSLFGRKELRKRLSNVTRVENGNDLVTKVPLFLYKHYGKLIHIGTKRKVFRFSIKDHTTYKDNL